MICIFFYVTLRMKGGGSRVARAYYGSRISANMTKTPENFLICHNVPIARTGTQKYLAKEIGVDGNSNDIVTVYREPQDVFDKKTLASFEGKVFTDDHPIGWLDASNVMNYAKGVITNVRRGVGRDEDLLLADIVVYSQDTVDKIKSTQGMTPKREVSCGYECNYEKFKDGYKQVDIVGNHVSLVEAGRAGERVAIKDSEEELSLTEERRSNRMEGYKIPNRKPQSSITNFLKAVGLKAVVQDSEPEDILNVVDELANEKIDEMERDEEPIIIEREMEEEVEDDDFEGGDESRLDELESKLDSVIGMVQSILGSDDEMEDEEPDELDMLDDLEEELLEEDSDMMEEEESVTVDPEDMQEDEDPLYSGEEVLSKATDGAALALLKQFKPIIASMPDKAARKKATDALVAQVRKVQKDSSKNSAYSDMNSRNKMEDAKMDDKSDLGREIASKYNPHYKK